MFELALPVAQVEIIWPLMVVLGIVLGMASSALGIGAGVISVPILFAVYGIDFTVAASSSLALLAGNAIMGVIGHWRKGNVDPVLGVTLGGGVSMGALLGGWVLSLLAAAGNMQFAGRSKPIVQVVGAILFSCLLLWLGVMTLRKVAATVRTLKGGGADAQEAPGGSAPAWLTAIKIGPMVPLADNPGHHVSVWPILGVGAAAGVFAGMLGVGGGFLLVPVLLYWFGSRTALAVGTSLTGILVGALIGTVQKSLGGAIDWTLVGVLLAGGIIGIPLGLFVVTWVPPHELRRGYGLFCFLGVFLSLSKLIL